MASEIREVTLRPAALQAIVISQVFRNPLVRRAVFGTEQTYERWRTIAKAMEQAQGRRPTPLFRALSRQAPSLGERAEVLEFAPASLARTMSDPASSRALLYALKSPNTLAQSQSALRLKAAAIVEMEQGENVG